MHRDTGKGWGSQHSNWEETEKKNAAFEQYYSFVPDYPRFLETLRTDLPLTFRVVQRRGHEYLDTELQTKWANYLTGQIWEGKAVGCPEKIPFNPHGWTLDVGKQVIRKNPQFQKFQRYLVMHTEIGSIARQEAVSMLPPIVLAVEPQHAVLDMCAAPGSKTLQLVEALHRYNKREEKVFPQGFIIANDVDPRRANMLVHQTKSMDSPNLIITSQDASQFPNILDSQGQKTQYDRILADVPCSGDGTIRKNPNIWNDWSHRKALGLHTTQLRILIRGMQLLRPGGRIVYSTCSLNPIEDEAVVAAALERCLDMEIVPIDLPGLKYCPGMTSWKVMGYEGEYLDSPAERLRPIPETCFPRCAAGLEKCKRVYPHLQNSGGFFFALFEKKELKRESDEQNAATVKKIKLDDTHSVQADISEKNEEVDASNEDNTKKYQDVPNGSDNMRKGKKQMNGQPTTRTPNFKSRFDPFIFIDKQCDLVESIESFYDVKPDFTSFYLLRNRDLSTARTLYYISPKIKELVQSNPSIRWVHGGIKMFVRQAEREGQKCHWRIQSEGVETVLDYFGEDARVLEMTDEEAKGLITAGEFPKLSELPLNLVTKLHKFSPGCIIGKLSFGAAVPLWKGPASASMMVAKEDKQALLYRLENPLTSEKLGLTLRPS